MTWRVEYCGLNPRRPAYFATCEHDFGTERLELPIRVCAPEARPVRIVTFTKGRYRGLQIPVERNEFGSLCGYLTGLIAAAGIECLTGGAGR